MISRVTGKLVSVGEQRVEVTADALTYEVFVPQFVSRGLTSRIHENIEFFVYYYQEGGFGGSTIPRLAGFLSEQDREFFEQFIKVQRLGVRTALKALVIPMAEVALSIEAGDTRALSEMPGIGKRTAEKIVAELKGKLKPFLLVSAQDLEPAAPLAGFQEETLEALQQLDFKRFEALRMIRLAMDAHPEIEGTEELIKEVFKQRAAHSGVQ